MTNFKPGDRVCLRTGNVTMMVERVDEFGVRCVWQPQGIAYRETYSANALELAAERGRAGHRPADLLVARS